MLLPVHTGVPLAFSVHAFFYPQIAAYRSLD